MVKICSIIYLVIIFQCLIIGCSSKSDEYIISVESGSRFTEEMALEVSRKTLESDGKVISEMIPAKYRESGVDNKYFARNVLNPDRGYVLWHKKGENCLYEYVVEMHKNNDKVSCKIFHAK